MKHKTIAIDLDGTLAQYDGWHGINYIGDPIPGAKEFCQELIDQGYGVTVFSSRDHTGPIWSWLVQHRFPAEITVSIIKPVAIAYIDDRAIHFDGGNWDAVRQMIKVLAKK